MNYTTAVFLINSKARAILATYEVEEDNTKTYVKRTLFKTLDPTIQVGDIVAVPSKTRHHVTTTKVVEVDVDVDYDDKTPVDWVIAKIDQKPYEEILEQEKVAIKTIKSAEDRAQRAALRAKLDADKEAIAALKLAYGE